MCIYMHIAVSHWLSNVFKHILDAEIYSGSSLCYVQALVFVVCRILCVLSAGFSLFYPQSLDCARCIF